MSKQQLEGLLSESGEPCVSIIVPTHRTSPDRTIDAEVLKRAVKEAKEVIKIKYPEADNSKKVIKNIDELVSKIDYVHSKEGIGIYVSPRIAKLIKFPFSVNYKIKVDTAFDSRDLLYNINTAIDYCVLSISKKHIRLFMASGEEFHEINNDDFPLDYEDIHEYSKPSRGTSFGNSALKEFELDKSVLQEIRLKEFLRTTDDVLKRYINTDIPLLVSGSKKEISDYLEVTQYKKRIIGKITGNYNFDGDMQLKTLASKEVQNYLKIQHKILLSNLRELIGKKMVTIGIEEVWKAAKEGMGLQLIVEKDFESHVFVKCDNEYEIRLNKTSGDKRYTFVSDAVERVIKIVRERDGKIEFVDNGEMKDFDGIALRLRYPAA